MTGLPDPPPRADTRYVVFTAGPDGWDVKEIDWAVFAPPDTVIFCWAWKAAWYLSFPAWLASMTQVPGWLKATVAGPDREHTAALGESTVKVTGLPDPPPRADTRYVVFTAGPDGWDVKEIDWAVFAPPDTVIFCWAWKAAWYLSFPAWLASMTQVPGWLKATVPGPDREHTAALGESTAKVTGLPDPPPCADTRYLMPTAGLDGWDVKEIDWAIRWPGSTFASVIPTAAPMSTAAAATACLMGIP